MLYLVIFALLSPLFCTANIPFPTHEEGVVHRGKRTKLIIPKNPLAAGSIKCESIKPKNFSSWDDDDHLESFGLMQKVFLICKEKGITNYLVYGGEANGSKSAFSWEIIPHPKNSWLLGRQLNILWNITFGAPTLLQQEREQLAARLRQEFEGFSHSKQPTPPTILENDIPCDHDTIRKELIFGGKEVNVLCDQFDFHNDIHFLLSPKRNRRGLPDLSESEYLETMQLARKLVKFYEDESYKIAHLFHRTGASEGGEITHWIHQVILSRTKTQDFFGKLVLAKNLITGASPITEEAVRRRVSSFREHLGEALLS